MKAIRLVFPLALAFCTSLRADFLPGSLALLRAGDGTQVLANAGNTLFVDEFSVAGSLIGSTQIPDSGASALVQSGTATAEGYLALSANSQYLTFAGYNTPRPYSASVATSPSASVPRAVGMLAMSKSFSIPASSSTAYNTLSWRAAVSDGNNNYWGIGSGTGGGGPLYMGNTTSAGMLQTTLITLRSASIFNGNLYFSHSGSAGSGTGIYGFTGLPTAATAPTQIIATGASAAPNEFVFNAAGNLVYIADDRTTAAGGIQRWDFDGSVWGLTYTLGTGVANTGARGLAVDFTGINPTLYATTGEASGANRLIQIVDTGGASLATTLATSLSNTRFRGLELIPVPEPSTFVLAGFGIAALLIFRRRK